MSVTETTQQHSVEADLEKNIVDATLEVFSSMIFIDITAGKSQVGQNVSIESDLTSLLGLAGDLKGLVGIHCTEDAAKSITSSMLGMEIDTLDEDVQDAIGEIANMIAGSLKISFAEHNLAIQLAIPTTVIGKGLRTSGISGGGRILVPFTTENGMFAVEVQYLIA